MGHVLVLVPAIVIIISPKLTPQRVQTTVNAQQKRNLSIHEYQSYQLLNQVSTTTKCWQPASEPANQRADYSVMGQLGIGRVALPDMHLGYCASLDIGAGIAVRSE